MVRRQERFYKIEGHNEMKTENLPLAKKGLDTVNFVRTLQATDHVILFYNDLRDCRQLLFTFLKAGMDKGEAAIYVTGQEMSKQSQKTTDEFGVNVKRYEMINTLKIINYDEWYIIDGKVDIPNIMTIWRKAVDEAKERDFKGVRVCSEMLCFFKHDLADKVLEYENACHRRLEIPMTTICAYDLNALNPLGEKLFLDLLKAHSHILFAEPDLGFNVILEAVDDVLEKVLGTLSKWVLFSSLRNLFGLEREDIPKRIMDFSVALEKTFGDTTAGLLENMIFRELYLRLKERSICTVLEAEE
jgi:hypothetical protein